MKKIRLPEAVTKIYEAVEDLNRKYEKFGRKFTPDGHLVGSIGEVIAAEALNLELYKMSKPGHDARDAEGNDVQIKMTAGKRVSMSAECDRLVVFRIVSPREAVIVYDGPGKPVWEHAGKPGKNGRAISLHKLGKIAGTVSDADDKWTWHDGDVEWETIPDPAAKPIIAPEDVELAKQLLRELEADRSIRQKSAHC
jgi:Family of unknown function (DUF6998)